MAWKPDDEETLRRLWVEENLSASNIAKEMGKGFTRNMVIGKARRMDLPNRPSPIKREEAN